MAYTANTSTENESVQNVLQFEGEGMSKRPTGKTARARSKERERYTQTHTTLLLKLEFKEEVSRKFNEGRLPDETIFFHSRLSLVFKKESRGKQSKAE